MSEFKIQIENNGQSKQMVVTTGEGSTPTYKNVNLVTLFHYLGQVYNFLDEQDVQVRLDGKLIGGFDPAVGITK